MKNNHSPWGKIDYINPVVDGIDFVSTSSHGGYRLSEIQNEKIHWSFRNNNGFYEEDCEWAFVYITFPELFPLSAHKIAMGTIARYYSEHMPTILKIIDTPYFKYRHPPLHFNYISPPKS